VSVDEQNIGATAADLIVVVPLSSSRAPSPLRPEVPASAGVDQTSRAICRAVRGLACARLLRRLGKLDPESLAEIERALSLILGMGDLA
jgi:mRNA interferase MazF